MTVSLGIKGWERTRLRILERDGYICQIPDCRVGIAYPADSVDHIVPRALGGVLPPGALHGDANLRAAHKVCNSRRGVPMRMTVSKAALLPAANASRFDER